MQIEGIDFASLDVAPVPILYAVKAFKKEGFESGYGKYIGHYFAFWLDHLKYTLCCKQFISGRDVCGSVWLSKEAVSSSLTTSSL